VTFSYAAYNGKINNHLTSVLKGLGNMLVEAVEHNGTNWNCKPFYEAHSELQHTWNMVY